MKQEFTMIQGDDDYALQPDGGVIVCDQIKLYTDGSMRLLVTSMATAEDAIEFGRVLAQAHRFLRSQLHPVI
jgi:hypothetical protein